MSVEDFNGAEEVARLVSAASSMACELLADDPALGPFGVVLRDTGGVDLVVAGDELSARLAREMVVAVLAAGPPRATPLS